MTTPEDQYKALPLETLKLEKTSFVDFIYLRRKDIDEICDEASREFRGTILRLWEQDPRNQASSAPQSQASNGDLETTVKSALRELQIETRLAAMQITVSPTTHAQYYHTLQPRIKTSANPKDFNIVISKVPFVVGFKKKTFKTFLNDIIAYATRTGLEEQLQQAWFVNGDWCDYYQYEATTKMFDTHNNPLSSGRKPDIVHVIPGNLPSESTIVAIGDLKRVRKTGTKKQNIGKEKRSVEAPVANATSSSSGKETKPKGSRKVSNEDNEEIEVYNGTNFSPDSQGRALDFARLICESQSYRARHGIVSYVSNGHAIQFYLYKGVDDITVSPPLPLNGIGGEWYFGLMTTPLSNFGMVFPTEKFVNEDNIVSDVNVEAVLGCGATGVVYLCHFEGKFGKFAMKCFIDAKKAQDEKLNIEWIRSNIDQTRFVIDLLGETTSHLGLLLSPVCRDVSNLHDFGFSGDQLLQLINVVSEINTKGFVLRDLRPSNILIQSDDTICLVDLGAAVVSTTKVIYEGTSKFASSRILQELLNSPRAMPLVTALPEDDFHSVVKLCYVSLLTRSYTRLKMIGSFQYQEIVDFWRDKLSVQMWSALERNPNNWDMLRNLVISFIPTTADKV